MVQSGKSGPAGRLSGVLAGVADLFGTDPALLEARSGEILDAVPGQQQALLLLVCARRMRGDKAGARGLLEAMAKALPGLAAVQYELGLLLGGMGESRAAAAAFSRVVALEPNHPLAWRALGDQLARTGDNAAAGAAYARQVKVSLKELTLLEDAAGQDAGQLGPAENMLRELLKVHRSDAFLMHRLAKIGMRLGRYDDAEQLLARALDIAPAFTAARHDYVALLDRRAKWGDLLSQLDILLKSDPLNPRYRALRASSFMMAGEYKQALADYEKLLADDPSDVHQWIGYGHALRAVGRHNDGVAAYRRALELRPAFGSAYRSLANLKTFRFSTAEIATLRSQVRRADLPDEERQQLLFALGRASEDQGEYAESFEHFRKGSVLRRMHNSHDPEISHRYVQRCKAMFTPEFFRVRAGSGCTSPDPIFVVGLPRSGSTLIEQILASHSAIEGTTELPDLVHLVARLDGNAGKYWGVLGGLGRPELQALGEEYLERTRIQRKLGKPFFIDKLPNNFEHVGFIHLILPNARIIDMRRHPLSCGWSMFSHDFIRGMNYTYDLASIGRYYCDYVELMAHFDAVLPGRVHRVFYEALVRDPEGEIRRLLDYCGVPFEAGCLRFYETERGVRTASSEQVRRPIYADAVEQWRHYEPWLGPLKAALGPVLDRYPAVPAF